MSKELLQQAVEALIRARTFVLNGVSLAEPADETLPVIEAAIAALEPALLLLEEPREGVVVPRELAFLTWEVLSEHVPCAWAECKCVDSNEAQQAYAAWKDITGSLASPSPQDPEARS